MHLTMGKRELYRRWNNYSGEETVGIARDELTLENYNYYSHEDDEENEDGFVGEEEDNEGDDDVDEIENYSKYSPNASNGARKQGGCESTAGSREHNPQGGNGTVPGSESRIFPQPSTTQRHKVSSLGYLHNKMSSRIHHHYANQGNCNPGSSFGFIWFKNASVKMQLMALSLGLLVCGFLSGYLVGTLKSSHNLNINYHNGELNSSSSIGAVGDPDTLSLSHVQNNDWSSGTSSFHGYTADESINGGGFSSSSAFPHDINETMFHKLINQISITNIHHNLKRVTQEVHTAGTSEGHAMSIALRDLWRSYGLSVRVEQHKALLTRSTTFNYLEVFDTNGSSLLLTTSQTGDDVNLPNSVPILAFSPPAQLNGALIYGHYGRVEDLEFLNHTCNDNGQEGCLNGSMLLVRFSNTHPSETINVVKRFGVTAIVFYPDPIDFGPQLLGNAVKRDSLLTMAQIHEHQKHKKKGDIPCHTISFNDAERLLSLMRNAKRVMTPEGAFSLQKQRRLTTGTGEMEEGPSGATGSRERSAMRDPGSSKRKGRKYKRNPNSKIVSKVQYNLKRTVVPRNGFGLLKLDNTRLRIFNEAKSSNIYNVVASIPGTWESDRYLVVACSHDSWAYGAGTPGIGLAIMTEIVRVFTVSGQQGWKPRRSILFISFDANLYASNGLFHWLQEHHFEISTRAVAFIDLTRISQGNQTLYVYSSPLLKELVRKTINRIKRFDEQQHAAEQRKNPHAPKLPRSFLDDYPANLVFSSTLTSNELAFAFFGNLGIPFIRLSLSNSPKSYDYPLYDTAFDTYGNFVNLVDSTTLNGSETLGRIISGLILLLTDSSLLPMNVEDYVESIQKAFENFMVYYQEDLHKANLSIAYLQAAVMRLQVIGDNFRTDVHNRSVVNNEHYDLQKQSVLNHSAAHEANKLLFHRIINDKLMELDRAFLSRKSEFYKHQLIGYSSCSWLPLRKIADQLVSNITNARNSNAYQYQDPEACGDSSQQENHFPKLRQSLNCGRKLRERLQEDQTQYATSYTDGDGDEDLEECQDWRSQAAQEITLLTRCLDAAAAILQSPLLPEESDTSNNN